MNWAEKKRIRDAHCVWLDFAERMGWRLIGWSYESSASFGSASGFTISVQQEQREDILRAIAGEPVPEDRKHFLGTCDCRHLNMLAFLKLPDSRRYRQIACDRNCGTFARRQRDVRCVKCREYMATFAAMAAFAKKRAP